MNNETRHDINRFLCFTGFGKSWELFLQFFECFHNKFKSTRIILYCVAYNLPVFPLIARVGLLFLKVLMSNLVCYFEFRFLGGSGSEWIEYINTNLNNFDLNSYLFEISWNHIKTKSRITDNNNIQYQYLCLQLSWLAFLLLIILYHIFKGVFSQSES